MKEVHELLQRSADYCDGVQRGRELAIKNYDRILLELNDKLDKILEELRRNEDFDMCLFCAKIPPEKECHIKHSDWIETITKESVLTEKELKELDKELRRKI